MDDLERTVFDSAKEMNAIMTNAGHGMANALGSSLAASIGENKAFKAALKEQTHAVLMSLSQQAFAKAAFETAMGLAALALGPIGGVSAAGHFAAAAAFGAVGVSAGVGARATYTAPPATASSTPTTSRASAPTASRDRSDSSDRGGGPPSVTFKVYAPLGDPVAVGRAMDEAFVRYRQETGQEIGARR